MRNRQSAALASIAGLLVSLVASGCFDFFSDENLYLQAYPGTGGSGGTGGEGGTTTTAPDCIPNQTSNPIAEGCGTFVNAGAEAGGDGSPEKPFAKLSDALTAAKDGRVYACTSEKPLTEAIEVDGDAIVFGGLDCATWTYAAGTKTKWTAAADALPLRVADGGTVTLTDVAIEAADAVKDGGSSIAILAQAGALVDLTRCDVAAGNGMDGLTPQAPIGMGVVGLAGDVGLDGCVDATGKLGGNGGQLLCDGMDVGGGLGGSGVTTATGGDGSDGNPNDATTGLGGSGQKETPAANCTPGGDGAEGLPGDPGANATGTPSISSTGYQGKDGAPGAGIGKPGQGGGGGGGAKKCAAMSFAGPSAGGGGSGGCGGAVGQGGQAGGASIAIVSLGAQLLLSDVKLTAQKGGKGGDGGLGQPGGDGGAAGMPGMGDASAVACAGGKGGKGGPGGRGGGGLGGASLGIAHTGEAPDTKGATITVSPQGGNGGVGESGAADAGIAKAVQDF